MSSELGELALWAIGDGAVRGPLRSGWVNWSEAKWHRCNFAVNVADKNLDPDEGDALGLKGKLVLALGPHISRAASS